MNTIRNTPIYFGTKLQETPPKELGKEATMILFPTGSKTGFNPEQLIILEAEVPSELDRLPIVEYKSSSIGTKLINFFKSILKLK